jgi:hypothetical protein
VETVLRAEIVWRFRQRFGEIMKKYNKAIGLLIFTFLMLAVGSGGVAQEPPAAKPPANVAGNWTFYTKGDDGKTGTHYLRIVQDGENLTGHFKGPNQSGGIEGTVNLQHVVIKTKTFHVFTFRGRAEGDTIQGNCGIMGHHCTFQGVRTSGQQSSAGPD